jgi:hypothetical protein
MACASGAGSSETGATGLSRCLAASAYWRAGTTMETISLLSVTSTRRCMVALALFSYLRFFRSAKIRGRIFTDRLLKLHIARPHF